MSTVKKVHEHLAAAAAAHRHAHEEALRQAAVARAQADAANAAQGPTGASPTDLNAGGSDDAY